jgi:hypothetical protein
MVISKIWKCVESTNGAIQVGVEHQKHGVFGRRVSIDACLRVWKHEMHCNNENQFGIFFYLPYRGAPDDREVHWCIMFNDTGALYSVHVIFIIKYDGAFEH